MAYIGSAVLAIQDFSDSIADPATTFTRNVTVRDSSKVALRWRGIYTDNSGPTGIGDSGYGHLTWAIVNATTITVTGTRNGTDSSAGITIHMAYSVLDLNPFLAVSVVHGTTNGTVTVTDRSAYNAELAMLGQIITTGSEVQALALIGWNSNTQLGTLGSNGATSTNAVAYQIIYWRK